MPTARGGVAGAVFDGLFVVAGGEQPSGTFTEVEAFDKFKSFVYGAVRFVEGRGELHWKWRCILGPIAGRYAPAAIGWRPGASRLYRFGGGSWSMCRGG